MSFERGGHRESEVNNELYSVVGRLAAQLMRMSHDTGKAYFVNLEPVNPELPDEYKLDIVVRDPLEAA